MDKEKYAAGSSRVDTLTELCERINELLAKAIDISKSIVGEPETALAIDIKDIEKAVKSPECSIDVLRDKLDKSRILAQMVSLQLEDIASKI